MAKNFFKYINKEDYLWVDILHNKYGLINVWRDSILVGCSWFFRGLCYTAFKLKPNLRLNVVNPNQTSFLFHPWFSEVPLSLNPTFISINLDLETIIIIDLILNCSWDYHKLGMLFGAYVDHFIPKFINTYDSNHWIWSSKSLN